MNDFALQASPCPTIRCLWSCEGLGWRQRGGWKMVDRPLFL